MAVFAYIKTLLWTSCLILYMLLWLLALPAFLFVKYCLSKQTFIKITLAARYVWGRTVVRSTGSKVSFSGSENIPTGELLCFVGNHQSNFDIPAFLGYSGQPVGFIAKKELFKIPILSQWMRIINCVFIDRSDPRSAIESFKKAAEVIKDGFPQIIFPEGTRSKSDIVAPFQAGALKLPIMANAVIVPFAIKDSYKAFEIDNRIHAAQIKIKLLPPIFPDHPLYHGKGELADHIRDMIVAAKEEM